MAWYKCGGGGIKSEDVTATKAKVLADCTTITTDSDDEVVTGTLPLASVLDTDGGTIPSKAAATYTPSTSNQTIAAGQYLAGAQTIAGDADLVASNILNGKNIFGVAGNVRKYALERSTKYASGSHYFSGGTFSGNHPFVALGFYITVVSYQMSDYPQTINGHSVAWDPMLIAIVTSAEGDYVETYAQCGSTSYIPFYQTANYAMLCGGYY